MLRPEVQAGGDGTLFHTRMDCDIESLTNTTRTGTAYSLAPVGPQLAELRRLGGLTWPEMARLFAVDLDVIDAWESGAPVAEDQLRRLASSLQFVRRIWRGSAQETRAWLHTPLGGASPFERMCGGQTDLVPLPESVEAPPARVIDPAVLDARRPTRPELLLSALHEAVHEEPPSQARFVSLRKPR